MFFGRRSLTFADDARRWEACEIARCVQDIVAQGTIVFDKDFRGHHPVKCDDVATLFQSTTQITIYGDMFKAVGLL